MYFSIIIPVYNAEKTLTRCLESISRQSFQDYEVIMIDDGSEDGSLSICERFSEEDSRFLTIHQENAGPSAARNRGMLEAKGKYFCFVDSDDYIDRDYLEKLFEKADVSRADMIFFGYWQVDQTGSIIHTCIPQKKMDKGALLAALSEQDLFGYTWIKCFCGELVKELFFPEDMRLFEDEVFTCAAAKRAKKIVTIESPLYYYMQLGEDALTKRLTPDYCRLSDCVFQAWQQLLGEDPERASFLEKKANYFVQRCRYYGFEHPVNVKSFFSDLASTAFFKQHTKWDSLDYNIQSGNWFSIYKARNRYLIKQRLSEFSRRQKGRNN